MLNADIIHGFAGSLLSKKYDGATPTPQFHIDLWELFTNKHRCVAAAAPRGHGKSTAITFAYALANALFREKRFLVIVSDTEAQAINFISDIKTELKENEDLISLFGIKSLDKDTETSIIVRFDDDALFRIDAKGQGFKRGMKWDNKRPDLIICDDLENEEVVYNKERRDKFKRWFYGTVIPSLSKDGILRVVGTILHLDSLLNNLMPDEYLLSTKIEPLKTYNYVTHSQWRSVRYRAHSEDFSQILWPSRWPKEELIKIREDYTAKGLSDVYSQEYLNYPVDEKTSYFKRDDLLPSTEIDKKRNKRYYAATDFAISSGNRSDYTVIAVVGVDEEGRLHVEDMRRGRWDALEIINEMFSVHKRYKPELFVVERGAIEKAIGSVLRAEMYKRGVFLNIHPMSPTKDKQTRARSFQARLRSGGVRFDKEADWYPELEDEMARFPKARHDDQVDALSWIGLILDEVQDALTPQEEADEAYYEEMDDNYSGRDLCTGY
jgi:predicted phage terminase large subunit-like protein